MTLTEGDLRQFTGSECVYKHNLCPGIVYTEGVQYLAEKAGAYWLLDIIAANNAYGDARFKDEEFQAWKLVLQEPPAAVLTCDDGNGNIFFTQKIDYTDFPLPEVTLYFSNNTILLPSEW